MIKLGDEVVDVVTGFQGVATDDCEFLHGVKRFSVQPPVNKDGVIPEAYTIDVTSLKIVAPGKLSYIAPEYAGELKLGDTVKDTHTGFKGVISCYSVSLNGCVRVSVQPKLDKDGKLPKAEGFDILRLELVSETKTDPQRKTGGPMERSSRYGHQAP